VNRDFYDLRLPHANGGGGGATHKDGSFCAETIEPLQMTCPDCGPYACQIVGMWYPHPKIAFCLAGLKRSKDPSNTWILAVLDASTTVTSVVFRG